MSIRKTSSGMKERKKTGTAAVISHFFDVEKCKVCPHKEGCYKEGAVTKSFSVTLTSRLHTVQKELQETEEFKLHSKQRYKIEAKNSELKHPAWLWCCFQSRSVWYSLQGAFAIFAVNMKRILALTDK